MAINRYELVSRHNPVLTKIEYQSPLTIGNGEFAFTADITGLQSLYEEYKNQKFPLCTMSQWGWHTTPVNNGRYSYTEEDLQMTEYDHAGRSVTYAVEKKPGNEEVYLWLRQNPHRFNLGRLGFMYKGESIRAEDLSDISQTLLLYEGILNSTFRLHGVLCRVQTCCCPESDTIAIKIESELLKEGLLSVMLSFPYGSSDITASDWNNEDRHETSMIYNDGKKVLLKRQMDRTEYQADLYFDCSFIIENAHKNIYYINIDHTDQLSFTITFSDVTKRGTESQNSIQNTNIVSELPSVQQVFKSSIISWKAFWQNGGIIDLHQSKDERALELERRIILSMYQSAIQCCGSLPPQETGLTCNSWHGKFHLEMYPWHLGYLPLWNRTPLLMPSLDWYLKMLPKARANAARNGYRGAKWPKQVAYDAVDSPSPIATLLIWQQPHIICMLESVYQSLLYQEKDKNRKANYNAHIRETSDKEIKVGEFLQKYWKLVEDTADYMVDLAVYNKDTTKYDLLPPIIPAQEAHDPKAVRNPIFEVEYWRYALLLAAKWAMRLDKADISIPWINVAKGMAELPIRGGLYLAHGNCPDTFEKFNKDHPMMLAVYGLIDSDRVDRAVMLRTLEKTVECWDYSTMWGWDFAMMAMTAVRLGFPELAIRFLLMDTPNNQFGRNGHNNQEMREDLPVYLPGNGSLLLAVTMMTAGYNGCSKLMPGFPDNGMWTVEYEDICPIP